MQIQSSKLQLVIKSLIALLGTAVITALVVAILMTVEAGQPQNFAIAFLFAFAFTAAYTFIVGGPLLLLGAWRHAIYWWSCLLIGFLVGLVPTALVAGTRLFDAWPMGVFGLIGGLVFWLLWRYWVQSAPKQPVTVSTEQPAGNGD